MTPGGSVDFIALSAIWGASFLFMQFGAAEFGPLASAAIRVAIASALLMPLVFMRGQMPVFMANWKQVCAIGVVNSAIPFALYSFALLSISTGLSAILNATVPMFGAIVAWLWLHDRPTSARVAGLVIGFAGVALLAWDKASFAVGANGVAPAWAVLACLLATLFYGIAANAAKRYLTGVPALVTAAGSQLGATLALALPALWFWPARLPGLKAWLAVAALGVLCSAVAYILYFRLIEHGGPTRATSTTFVVPVFAVLYGVMLLGEPVTSRMLACGAIIVCGTALTTGLLRLGRREAP